MSSVTITKLKSTSGTASAVITDDDYFTSFKGESFFFYPEKNLKKWGILTDSLYDEHGQGQAITLWIPDEGDVKDKTYEITGDVVTEGKAHASWARTSSAGYDPYPSISGTVTVTLNVLQETAKLDFNFLCKKGGKHVKVEKGIIEVKGLLGEKKISQPGAVTCTLSDSVTLDYTSTVTTLAKRPETIIFPEHLEVWSQQYPLNPTPPFPPDYRLVLSIAKNVSLGTYSFSPDSKHVRLFFYDMSNGYYYSAQKGEMTLTSILDFETLTGTLSGRFNFTSTIEIGNGNTRHLIGNNGKLDITQ